VHMQLVRPLLDAQPSGPEPHRRKLAEDCCPAGFVKVAQLTGARPGCRALPLGCRFRPPSPAPSGSEQIWTAPDWSAHTDRSPNAPQSSQLKRANSRGRTRITHCSAGECGRLGIAGDKSPWTEKCGIADHELLTGGGLLLMADISPDMSASIPAGPAWPFLTWSALLVTRLLVWLAELDKRDGRFLST